MGKILDLEAIRQASANLDRIAAEHPELLGKSTPEEWEKTLSEMKDTTRKTGSERQRELREKRLAKGLCRPEVWVSPADIEKLRGTFPGPRNGVNWNAVIAAALDKAGHKPEGTP